MRGYAVAARVKGVPDASLHNHNIRIDRITQTGKLVVNEKLHSG